MTGAPENKKIKNFAFSSFHIQNPYDIHSSKGHKRFYFDADAALVQTMQVLKTQQIFESAV